MTRATIVGTPLDLDAGEAGPAELRAAFARAHEPYVEPGAELRVREKDGEAEAFAGDRSLGVLRWGADRPPVLISSLDERLAEGLAELIARLARGGVSELPAAPPAHTSLLAAFNDTGQGYRLGRTVSGIFAARAERTPDRVGLQQGDVALTYGELHAQAIAVARALRAEGIGPGSIVPVVLDREPALAWSLLGVLMAGAAYAVMDRRWPAERLAQLMGDCEARFAIARSAPPVEGVAHALPEELAERGRDDETPLPAVDGDDPCCVFFTSGSTGRPKGVFTRHVGTVRAVVDPGYGELQGSCWLQAAALPWDAFSLELWGALLNGGRCVINVGASVTPQRVRDVIADGVDTMWLTASLFNLVVEEDLDAFAGLRRMLIGGERLSPRHVSRFMDRHPGIPLTNGYGPAEATIFTTTHAIRREDADDPAGIPLGRCLPNTRVHVLRDAGGERPWLVPVGAIGEICVAGDGLGLGYLGADADRRFTEIEVDGRRERLYRTGDLGAWRADGVLTFVGRGDREVKIRGHRVSPGEVEDALAEHPDVVEAAVVVDQSADERRLVAVVRPEPEREPDGGALRRWLGDRLPEFAVPARVMVRATLPRGTTGKLDRRAVEALLMDDAVTSVATVRDETSAVGIASVLLKQSIGLDADLVDAGMSSLAATRLAVRLGRASGREIGVSDVLRERTPRRIDALLAQRPDRPAATPARTGAGAGVLSRAQRRFWMGEQLDPGCAANLVLSAHHLHREPDEAALAAAVQDVVARHPQLRATFTEDAEPGPLASVDAVALRIADAPPPRPGKAAGDVARGLAEEEAARPFDLETSAARFTLTRLGDGSAIFMLGAHHIVIDGWSELALLADLGTAYAARRRSEAPAWLEPPTPYEEHVADESAWLGGRDAADAERDWWREALAGLDPLPAADGDGQPARSATVVPSRPGRPDPSLPIRLAALGAALHEELGANGRIGVGLVVSGRDDPRFEHTIGVFVNTVCVPVDLGPLTAERINAIAHDVDRALAHARLPFDEVVAAVAPERRGQRNPLCQVLVTAQDHASAQLDLGEGPITRIPIPQPLEGFDLVVETWPVANGLHATFEFAPGPWRPNAAERIAERWSALAAAANDG